MSTLTKTNKNTIYQKTVFLMFSTAIWFYKILNNTLLGLKMDMLKKIFHNVNNFLLNVLSFSFRKLKVYRALFLEEAVGFLSYYHSLFHSYDEQLLQRKEISQDIFPSQVDVLESGFAYLSEDDQENKLKHIPEYLLVFLLSMTDGFSRFCRTKILLLQQGTFLLTNNFWNKTLLYFYDNFLRKKYYYKLSIFSQSYDYIN